MGGNGVEIVATAKGESGRLRLAATTVANGFSSAYSVPLCFKDFEFPITAITGVPGAHGFGALGWDHARSRRFVSSW